MNNNNYKTITNMKYLLITISAVLLAVAGNVSARPFTTGCKWSYAHWDDCHETHSFSLFELDEPYELNGNTYYKLYRTNIDEKGNRGERQYIIGLREKDGIVYANHDEYMEVSESNGLEYDIYGFPYSMADNEIILYDFNLNVGEFIGSPDNEITYFISGIQPVTLENGKEERILDVTARMNQHPSYKPEFLYRNMISGIGSLYGEGLLLHYLDAYIYSPSLPPCETEHFLNAYVEDDRLVYKAPSYTGDPAEEHLSHTTYKDDPFLGGFVTGIKSVTAESNKADEDVFHDLSGRKMTGTLKPGVYIHNRKKIVVK